MKKHLFILILLFGVQTLLSETLKIGVLGTTSGPVSGYGISQQRGVMLAVEYINSRGGINGSPMEMVAYDDEGNVEKACQTTLRMVYRDQVKAIVGTAASAITMNVARILQRCKVPLITCISTHPRICDENFPWIFRNLPNDNYQVKAILDHLLLNEKGNIGVLYRDTAYGKSGLRAIEKFAAEKQIPILAKIGITPSTDPEISLKLKQLSDLGVENIVLWSFYKEGAEVVRTARKERYNFDFYGGDGLVYKDFIPLTEGLGEGVIVTLPYDVENKDPLNLEFVKKYQDKFNTLPDSFAAYAFDAVLILENALKQGTSHQTIRNFLSQTRNVRGVTGITTLDSNGDDTKPILLGIVEKDRFILKP